VLLLGGVILPFKNMFGFFKGFVDVAEIRLDVTDYVAFGVKNAFGISFGMHHHGAGFQGFLGIDHRFQHLVIHFNEFKGLLGDFQALGGHHGHAVAHVTHGVIQANLVIRQRLRITLSA